MMKIKSFFTIILLFILTINIAGATFFKASLSKKEVENIKNIDEKDLSVNEKIAAGITIKLSTKKNIEEIITQEILINRIADEVGNNVPKSYKYIKLNIKGVINNSKVYSSLQKLIYLDLISNKSFYFDIDKILTKYESVRIENAIIGKKITREVKKLELSSNNKIPLLKVPEKIEIETKKSSKELDKKQKIFQNVYDTLLTSHYDKNKLTEVELLNGAIKGLAKGTGDKFTTYFPPTENKDFMESLDGKFEGIGSYVEMEQPGILKIISPIPGSPSEKAGLKGGDIITEVNGKKITEKVSRDEAISWIKGPKKTTVLLTVLRKNKILKISVIRDTIIIKSVEYRKIDYKTFYISIKEFTKNVSFEFDEALLELSKDRGIKKVIIDLRNNPGGFLGKVSEMLGHFVPKGETTVILKTLNGNKNYYSNGKSIVDFKDYKIVILQNGGSASASEIFVGSLKDYFPDVVIIGTNSYGKGVVQTFKKYSDGSSLKYTIAKWFTGKTETGIDHIGIKPDIKLELDFERFKKTKYDNQLEKAKSLR